MDESKFEVFSIPLKREKVAIIRIEFPVTVQDIHQINKWLELLRYSIDHITDSDIEAIEERVTTELSTEEPTDD